MIGSKKIYLAKSNRANPDHVTAVRETLSKYDVEVVEYKGGSFSHKPMLDCDMLMVVPELEVYDVDAVSLGKGLYEQINKFTNCLKKKDNTFVLCDVEPFNEEDQEHGACFTTIGDMYIKDIYDYIGHATLEFIGGESSVYYIDELMREKVNGDKLTEAQEPIGSCDFDLRLLLIK